MVEQPPARDRLLDAADALLFTDGIAATPVDAILEEAHVSPATLYSHFGSKEGLVAAALRRRSAQWDEYWVSSIDSASGDVDRLLAVFPALRVYRSERFAARWCAFLGTTAATIEPGEELAAALAADAQLLTERLRALAGPVAGPDADALTRQLVLVFSGVLAMMLKESPEDAITTGEEIARRLVAAHTT